LILLILFNSIILSESPINLPIDYLQTRGFIELKQIKPYELGDIIKDVDLLILQEGSLNKIDKSLVSLFAPYLKKSNEFNILLNINGGKKFDTLYSNLDLEFAGKITSNISFGQGIRFHFGSKLDSAGPKPWKDIVQAYLNEGFLKIGDEKVFLTLGRRNLLLSYGDEHSLLLSPTDDGYDGYLFCYNGKYYEFSSNFAVIEPQEGRFLATHRIGLNLKVLKVGFSEAILWGDGIVPLYLNFFLPYYLSQWGLYRNDNIMWHFDGLLKFFNTYVYGEFLIDDYQFSEPPLGYTEYPHKLGFQCGVKRIQFEKLYIKFNYTFVDKWVYTHELPRNVYQKDSVCLGFPLGNDVDKLSFDIKFFTDRKIIPGINFVLIRKGEGSIFLPYEIERGPAYPPFPSGVVEKRVKLIPGIEFYLGQRLYTALDMGICYTYNFKHQTGFNKKEGILNIRVWLLF
jgi:hypothetical protein